MGADYTAYAVIGCEIDLSTIPVHKEKVKAFNHSFPEDMNFDPKSGAKLWKEDSYPEFCFGKNDQDDKRTKIIDIDKLKLYRGAEGCITVLGFGCGEDTYSNAGAEYDFKELNTGTYIYLYNKIKEVLSSIGMWDELKFGLYAILYCSY